MQYTDEQVIMGLTKVPGLGPVRIRELIEQVKKEGTSLNDVWKKPQVLREELGWPREVRVAFEVARQDIQLDRLTEDIKKSGCGVISFLDERFPEQLRTIASCPVLLYYKGDIELLKKPSISVVGTRQITRYGKLATEYFTAELCVRGYVIVSGFMYGVDAHAHRTVVEHSGKTVGVLGYGFEHLYPSSHKKLFAQILECGGCFISEYSPETPAMPSNFPQRNRIVSGLSKGVLVTEASAGSGSKITAQLAAEMGREVFAVSGSFTSPFSEGTKQLINLGAKLVTKVDDIIEEIEQKPAEKCTEPQQQLIVFPIFESEEERSIFELLRVSEQSIDEMGEDIHLPMSSLLTVLSMMEMKGMIVQEKGKYWLAKLYSA